MLNKDDVVQTVNFEGNNEEVYEAQFAQSKVRHSVPKQVDRLFQFLFKNDFKRGKINKTLFSKLKGVKLLIIQVYIDDFIFEATFEVVCEEFYYTHE